MHAPSRNSARLESGQVAPSEFDFYYLHREGGRFGKAALEKLVRSSDPALGGPAKRKRYGIAIGGAVAAGLVVLVLVSAWRQQKALMAVSAQNQAILEEIRALLKKNAGDPNKPATTGASAADRLRAQVTAASHLSRLVK